MAVLILTPATNHRAFVTLLIRPGRLFGNHTFTWIYRALYAEIIFKVWLPITFWKNCFKYINLLHVSFNFKFNFWLTLVLTIIKVYNYLNWKYKLYPINLLMSQWPLALFFSPFFITLPLSFFEREISLIEGQTASTIDNKEKQDTIKQG